jgi:hypothetical protein
MPGVGRTTCVLPSAPVMFLTGRDEAHPALLLGAHSQARVPAWRSDML